MMSVCSSVRLSVCLSVCQQNVTHKNVIFLNTKQFRATVSVDDQQEVLRGLINESIIEPLKFLRWRRSAILEIVISPYINERSSDFNEIWYTTADLELSDSH